jgi:hypothetical protein
MPDSQPRNGEAMDRHSDTRRAAAELRTPPVLVADLFPAVHQSLLALLSSLTDEETRTGTPGLGRCGSGPRREDVNR